jgi:hypothetical protein
VSEDVKTPPLRWAVGALFVLALLASVWWARTGADEYTGPPKSREEAVARVLGSSENFTAFQRYVDGYWHRASLIAPQFRSMRVVHELLLVSEVYDGPHGQRLGDGGYIDPAQMGDPTIGEGALPEVFAESSRGGYRFDFIGRDASIGYEASVTPYKSFVYVAWPESDAVGQYTFALHSSDKKIHYTTEDRVPGTLDPTVTDGMPLDGDASVADVKSPGIMSRVSAWGARLRRRFFTSGSDVAAAEARVVNDLRTFAAAQDTLFLMLGARGFASIEALNNPGTLEGVPDLAPLLDEEFLEYERDGYRYTFTGERLTEGGEPRLYRDYSYVALPNGDSPAGRRSFAIYPDGVIRVRTDGNPPLLIDPPLVGHK